jgi:hypothetical protein
MSNGRGRETSGVWGFLGLGAFLGEFIVVHVDGTSSLFSKQWRSGSLIIHMWLISAMFWI